MGVLLADVFIYNDRFNGELLQLSGWTKALDQKISKRREIEVLAYEPKP